ncbi:MAG: tetratricopeptide repeat protein [Anaerolineales bacterium]|nr:tetratricopeptide repeat protein [Anaerolineales bacterium]
MTGRQDLYDESMRLGHSAAWDMQWDRAIEFYRKALAEFPDDSTGLNSLGLALLETGRADEALNVYKQAASAAPNDPIPVEKCAEIHEIKGDKRLAIEQREIAADLYVRQRNADKAIENWCHSARLDPNNLAVRSRLSLTFERLGRKREAAHEYLAVASILQNNRKLERATEAAQMALRLQPADPEARSNLRALRQGKTLPPPAPPRGRTGPLRMDDVQSFMQADTTPIVAESETELDDPELAAQDLALTTLAGMLFEEGSDSSGDDGANEAISPEGMRARLGSLRQSVGGSKMYQVLGKAIDLQTRGNKRQAAKEFKRAIETGLDHPAAHFNLGLLLKDLHDYDGARQHLTVAVGHPELALGSNLALGRITRSQGNMSDAAHYLLQALRLADTLSVNDDQSAELNELYDTILATLNEGDENAISQIVENTLNILSGPDWMHRIRIARTQLESEGEGPTVAPIADLLSVKRTDRVVHALERIDHLASQGMHNSAMEEAMLALEYAPGYLGLHQRIGDILMQTGRREQALSKLNVIAETHRVRGESIQATKTYIRMLHLSPIDIDSRRRLIDMLTQQERTDEAIQQYLELAEIYRKMAEIDGARKTLAEALHFAQLNAVGRDWTIIILRKLGDIDLSRLDWKRALLVFEQIQKLDPTDDESQVHLIDLNLRLAQEDAAAESLDTYLQHLVAVDRGTEILPMLEEWTREYPGRQVLHARLAEAYRAVGQTADAIAQYDALGEIQLDAGQIREAARTIRTIIEMDPPGVEGYRDLLNNLESRE